MISGAIVLGGHIQGLGIARILGREGVSVVVIDNTSNNLARYSKYCKEFLCVEDDLLLDFLIQLGREHRFSKWVLFPTNDYHVKTLSKNKQLLEEFFLVTTDFWSKVNIFYNKREAYRLATQVGLPIAGTFFPDSENDLDGIKVDFPCIIKPAVMHDFYKQTKKKVFVCRDNDELKKMYRKAISFIPADEVIVQEVIAGPSRNQYSACFLMINGTSVVWLTACRMRQHPIDFGNATTYAETVDIPMLKEYGERILNAVGYNGLCEVEFKLDERDGLYKFLEVNTRTWKWHSIANKADTPFVKTFFDFLTGKDFAVKDDFQPASFLHSLTDIPVRIQLLLQGALYWRRKMRPIENAVWASDDVKPWFIEKILLLYYIFKR